ncbi:ER membrane protein complex subunit 10 [Neocloeon triangulifer]|uniref:ER membrane protein complex subunit 10 n=1 Tax=Neocloeon triangulifer TaxID=2078957 RepID=UPI00286ED1F0|nr:ER membrane protein complex subunit 10 [Neocloeon triangulifer]
MKKYTTPVFLGLLVFLEATYFGASYLQSEVDYDGQLSIELTHALDNVADPVFTSRGSVDIKSLRTGFADIDQEDLSPEDAAKIAALKNGIYRLRAEVSSGAGKKKTFLTFVDGCSLYESALSDILTVSLDHAGHPVAISMSTTKGVCDGSEISKKDLQSFNTTVLISHMEQAPIPDTSAYIQKLEREKEARERGETKDTRSFFAKYWMYIVPVVIFVLISSAANPEAAAGNGGGR